jgi:Tfp pilus assembly PilM family ATPase
MMWFLNNTYSIGVDIGDDNLNMIQLQNTDKGIALLAGRTENRPGSIEPGSAVWQRWAIQTLQEATAEHRFHGKSVIAAVPTSEVFIENIKLGEEFAQSCQNNEKTPCFDDNKTKKKIMAVIKAKLPFDTENAMIQNIHTIKDNIIVMATERKIIDRHLAIYEKAGLTVKSIGAWPIAMANCYAGFFGRRKTDLQTVVMLLDIGISYTNMVICRHKNVLFACSILMGAKQLDDDKKVLRLVFELNACRNRFSSMYPDVHIERLIFLGGPAMAADIGKTIAEQMNIQAQMADCLAAVQIPDTSHAGIDTKSCQANWATAFGLSLS